MNIVWYRLASLCSIAFITVHNYPCVHFDSSAIHQFTAMSLLNRCIRHAYLIQFSKYLLYSIATSSCSNTAKQSKMHFYLL